MKFFFIGYFKFYVFYLMFIDCLEDKENGYELDIEYMRILKMYVYVIVVGIF